MTNNIIINDKNRTIEITKKFANAAKVYGSIEYEDLKAAKADFPKYRVVIKAVKKGDCFKGLTTDYMEAYIQQKIKARAEEINNSGNPEAMNEFEDILKEFYTLRGLTENGEKQEMAATASYGELKQWFLAQFTELKTQRKAIDEILNKAKAKVA